MVTSNEPAFVHVTTSVSLLEVCILTVIVEVSTFGFGININLIELNYACFKLDEFDEYLKQYSLTIDVSKLKDLFNEF